MLSHLEVCVERGFAWALEPRLQNFSLMRLLALFVVMKHSVMMNPITWQTYLFTERTSSKEDIRFGRIDDFSWFFTKWGAWCNFWLKSCWKRRNTIVCAYSLQKTFLFHTSFHWKRMVYLRHKTWIKLLKKRVNQQNDIISSTLQNRSLSAAHYPLNRLSVWKRWKDSDFLFFSLPRNRILSPPGINMHTIYLASCLRLWLDTGGRKFVPSLRQLSESTWVP